MKKKSSEREEDGAAENGILYLFGEIDTATAGSLCER